jgi:hypothetical protein
MKLKSLLKSKLVLYTTFVVAILHVLGYIAVDDDKALLFFIALGVLTTFFSKNMIIVLVVAIVGTNVLFAGNAVREGLTNAQAVEEKEEKEKKAEATADKKVRDNSEIDNSETFTQINIPSSKPAPATESEEDEAIGKRIDYASTLEQAYDNLQQMLGPDGIKGLSKETESLVHQQKSLIGTLNDMAPVLKTAKETLDTMSGSMPDFGNIQSLMKSFGGGLMGKKKESE